MKYIENKIFDIAFYDYITYSFYLQYKMGNKVKKPKYLTTHKIFRLEVFFNFQYLNFPQVPLQFS